MQALQQFGWTDGGNARIDTRWGGLNAGDIRKFATELVELAPDVILTSSSAATAPMLQATRPFRLCSRLLSTQSAPAMSTTWRGRVAMPPALPSTNIR